MAFNTILFFAVLFITALFLYLAYTFKRNVENKTVTYEGQYHIEISTDFSGQDLSLYVNDSLLMNQVMPDTLVQLDIHRFADEHILMIVDNRTDNATPFNLSKEGGKVTVKKQADETIIEETPARLP